MKTISIGKMLITLVGLMTAFGSYAFDWNNTHIFNDNWPPHAKFHNAQTMVLGTLLGLFTIWLLWFRKGEQRTNLKLAVTTALFYWIGQIGASMFPGTALLDPEFTHPGQLPAQLIVCVVIFGLLGIAFVLETKKLNSNTAHRNR
ncbi:DUF6640 family protein [Chryseolinea sp. T2]|uniref:DUF6640 family protein n=1 Tax=Chryseolinea sp. T2 TaxID=3129255 RepID=UPI003077DF33